MDQNNNSGLKCPACGFNIKFTMQDLLMKKEIVCPSCHLSLTIDRPIDTAKQPQAVTIQKRESKDGTTSH